MRRNPSGRPVSQTAIDKVRAAWVAAAEAWAARTPNAPAYRVPVRYDGGTDPHTGRRRTAVWPRLAEAIEATGLTVDELVQALFSTAPAGLPAPDDLVAPSNVEKARGRRRTAGLELPTRLRSQQGAYTAALLTYGSAGCTPKALVERSVIANPAVPLSPLFRYAVALLTGHTDMAELLKPAAMVQYETMPDKYAAAWGTILPPELARKAGAV
jgi:hypothetical protein